MRGEAVWMYGGDQRVSDESAENRTEVERQLAAAKALFLLLGLRHDGSRDQIQNRSIQDSSDIRQARPWSESASLTLAGR